MPWSDFTGTWNLATVYAPCTLLTSNPITITSGSPGTVTHSGGTWSSNCNLVGSKLEGTGDTINVKYSIERSGNKLICRFEGIINQGDPLWETQEGGLDG